MCGFVVYGLYYVEICSCYAYILKSFFFLIINGCWILLKTFPEPVEMIIWFLSFSVNMVYHIGWFVYTNESLHLWNKAQLIMMYDLFNVLLDSVCYNFVEDFLHICPLVILAYSFLFFCDNFVWFFYKGDGDFIKWVWKFSFLCDFLVGFEQDKY